MHFRIFGHATRKSRPIRNRGLFDGDMLFPFRKYDSAALSLELPTFRFFFLSLCYVSLFVFRSAFIFPVGRRFFALVPNWLDFYTPGFRICLFIANHSLRPIRYLRDMISTYVLTPTILPALLFTVRTTLFPSNSRPGSVSTNANNVGQQSSHPNNDASHPIQQLQQGQSFSGTDHQANIHNFGIKDASTPASGDSTPSPSEIAAIKRQCATDILSLIPETIARAFLRGNLESQVNGYTTNDRSESSHGEIPPCTSKDSSPDWTADKEELLGIIESDLLDPFSDAYCNKHLVYAIIELVLIRLIPELSEQSINSLMEERGIVS